jgi:hypothetical protein
MEKDEISKGLSESDLADSCSSEVNDAGTRRSIDTRLTQRRSPTVHGKARSLLLRMRVRHGALTPIGHRYSNLMKLLEVEPGATGERRKSLEKSISRQLADLAKLTAGG